MKQKTTLSMLCSAFLVTACVTINIYFPAAAAEKVADEIIKDIQKPVSQSQQPDAKIEDWQLTFYHWLDDALNIIISPAHAGGADLSIDTPEIRSIRASMQKRFPALKAYYAKAYIGIQSDGFLTVRNPGAIPPPERNKVKKLVAAENADRNKLYQAIANANGHSDWYDDIKATFAKRWISNAQTGWWYQTANGVWQQK
jgi:uncharacterized protein YdbL (DUF1318 family)